MNTYFLGNLGGDPKVGEKDTQPVKMRVAVDDGNRGKTTWVTVNAFGKLGQICATHLKKGAKIMVDGRLEVRDYTDKSGKDRYDLDVVANNIRFAGGKKEDADTVTSDLDTAGAPF